MRLVLALVFMLMLASSASAGIEKASTGPYNVSFDLLTAKKHTVQEEPGYHTPEYSVYRLLIANDNSTRAEIGIVEFKNLSDSTLPTAKNFAGMRMVSMGYYINATFIDLKNIDDGKKGFVTYASNKSGSRLYMAEYWLDSKDCECCGPVSVGTTKVGIISSYPLDNTASLLATIHVEKGKK